ncbi:MAG: ArdC family protein, partial [Polyangiales bacterium]
MRGKEIQQDIMATIVAELESGVLPWAPPWESGGGFAGIPFNYQTRRPYSGGNVLLLWTAMKHHGFVSPAFVTYRQAREAGGHVLKGERGVSLVYWNPTGASTTGDDDNEGRRFPVLRRFRVFNV